MTNTTRTTSVNATTSATLEPVTAFLARAKALSGLRELDWEEVEGNLSLLTEGDCLPGGIVARRGNVYLCTVGYPDGEREDGSPFWAPNSDNWRLCAVVTADKKAAWEKVRGAWPGQTVWFPGMPDQVFLDLWKATEGCFPLVGRVLSERRLFHKVF